MKMMARVFAVKISAKKRSITWIAKRLSAFSLMMTEDHLLACDSSMRESA